MIHECFFDVAVCVGVLLLTCGGRGGEGDTYKRFQHFLNDIYTQKTHRETGRYMCDSSEKRKRECVSLEFCLCADWGQFSAINRV